MNHSRYQIAILMVVAILVAGCKPLMINSLGDRFTPSNARDWSPEFAVSPAASFSDDAVRLHNVRNVNYVTEDDFVVKYYDRTVNKNEITSVDFIVTPFQTAPQLAHTMFSFGLTDGTYLGVSVEIRKEVGEKYSPLLGLGNQYEIAYVVADERDLVRLRTRHLDADVYVFPTVATPEQAQELFASVMHRVNKLYSEPEFYNSVRNNCTTNLVDHVNNLRANRVAFGWRILLPGFSAEYAYDLGLLDNSIPFEDLQTIAYVSDLAERYHDSPDFSQQIRSRRRNIARIAAGQRARFQTLNSSGQEFLDQRVADQQATRLR